MGRHELHPELLLLPERIAEIVRTNIHGHQGQVSFLLDEVIAQVCAISLLANKTPKQVLEFLVANAPELEWPEDALERLLEGAEDE